jgi:hypothetical protein
MIDRVLGSGHRKQIRGLLVLNISCHAGADVGAHHGGDALGGTARSTAKGRGASDRRRGSHGGCHRWGSCVLYKRSVRAGAQVSDLHFCFFLLIFFNIWEVPSEGEG